MVIPGRSRVATSLGSVSESLLCVSFRSVSTCSSRSRLTLSDDQLFDKRLKSPAGLERAIGKANVRDYLADLITKPVTGTDLVRKSKSNVKRYAAQTTAERHFQKPNETVRKDH